MELVTNTVSGKQERRRNSLTTGVGRRQPRHYQDGDSVRGIVLGCSDGVIFHMSLEPTRNDWVKITRGGGNMDLKVKKRLPLEARMWGAQAVEVSRPPRGQG